MEIIEKIKNLFKEIWTEAKKVNWPTKSETLRYSLIVIGISAGVAVFLGILDFVLVRIINYLVF